MKIIYEYMNIIILIIASDNTDNYIKNQNNWRRYMNLCNPTIRSFFIKNDNLLKEDVIVINDTIYIKDNETYIPGILSKTIKSIQYCLNNFEFDYIYRTNLSSVLNLYKMNDFINTNILNYGGVIGDYNGIKYASGSGFFLSKDACIYLCQNNNLLDYTIIDDLSIGKFLNKKYDILFIDRINIDSLEDNKYTINNSLEYNTFPNNNTFLINNNIFHFRCKSDWNNSNSSSIMNKIINIFYKKTNKYIMNIITGEKLQNIANIFIGDDGNFNGNPLTQIKDKNVIFNNIINKFNNPKIIFSYSHNIKVLSEKIDFFENNFILITHNSDMNIIEHEITNKILNCNKLIKWYAQNLCFEHNKLIFLPIGLANSQWLHGNLDFFKNINNTQNLEYKFHKVYMNFSINNNYNKRIECYDKLKDKIPFLHGEKYYDYLTTLSQYEFCICPEGNGIDTHRFWEALYLKVVPIVISNPLVNIIKKETNLPILIINDWNDINIDNLKYEDYIFDKNNEKYLSLEYYKDSINNIVKNIK